MLPVYTHSKNQKTPEFNVSRGYWIEFLTWNDFIKSKKMLPQPQKNSKSLDGFIKVALAFDLSKLL